MATPGLEGFVQLPLEVLSLILGALSTKDLLRCRETCQGLNTVIANVPILQYTLALAAYGLTNNENSTKPINEKLERARLTYRGHRDFNWIPHFALQLGGKRIEHPSSPLAVGDATSSTSLTFILSGSIVRDVPDRQWTVNPLPDTAFSRSFNVSEDLLVLQTQDIPSPRFHLRTISDGGVHPEAALPVLPGGSLGVDHLTYGPFILVPGGDSIHSLWNWKTGTMLTMIRCHYSAVSFLDADHLAFVSRSDLGQFIHVYRLPSIIFDPDAETMNPPHYVFNLPTIAPDAVPLPCSMMQGPASSYMASGSTASAGACYTDPEEVLLTVYYEQLSPRRQYALVLRARSLLERLTAENLGQTTPWTDWGPSNAHGYPLSRRRLSGWDNHSIFGMRRIDTYPTVRSDGVLVATIYDYHARRVALARQEAPAENGRWSIVEGQTVHGNWAGTVILETRMPFVRTTVVLPAELQSQRDSAIALTLNDDGIIASTGLLRSSATTVHVYTI
ncbi:hypothetical protein PENSPDRAFT_731847 [Peniophora sp. CONT]|nr:hypothetical protein PENSPDRAFT_731847 [Peniophora sp. CONT]